MSVKLGDLARNKFTITHREVPLATTAEEISSVVIFKGKGVY
jgi:hypothetical protein